MQRKRVQMDDENAVMNAISLWHTGAGGDLELHEFLGWTWAEYSQWVGGDAPVKPREVA